MLTDQSKETTIWFWGIAIPVLFFPLIQMISPVMWPRAAVLTVVACIAAFEYIIFLSRTTRGDLDNLLLLTRTISDNKEHKSYIETRAICDLVKHYCGSRPDLKELKGITNVLARAGRSFIMSNHSRRLRQYLYPISIIALLIAVREHYQYVRSVSMQASDPIESWLYHVSDLWLVLAVVLLALGIGFALSRIFTNIRGFYFIGRVRAGSPQTSGFIVAIIALLTLVTLGVYYWAALFRNGSEPRQLTFLLVFNLFVVCPFVGAKLQRRLSRWIANVYSRLGYDYTTVEEESDTLPPSAESKLMRKAQYHLFNESSLRACCLGLLWWFRFVLIRKRPIMPNLKGEPDSGDSALLRARMRMIVRFLKLINLRFLFNSYLNELESEIENLDCVSGVAVIEIARQYSEIGDYEKARHVLLQRFETWESIGSTSSIEERRRKEQAYICLHLAQISFRQGNVNEAIELSQKGLLLHDVCPWLHNNRAYYLAVKSAIQGTNASRSDQEEAANHISRTWELIRGDSNPEPQSSESSDLMKHTSKNRAPQQEEWSIPKHFRRLYYYMLDTVGYIFLTHSSFTEASSALAHHCFWKAAFQGRNQEAFLHLSLWHLTNPFRIHVDKSELLAHEVLDRQWHRSDARIQTQASLILGFIALLRTSSRKCPRNLTKALEIAYIQMRQRDDIPCFQADLSLWAKSEHIPPMSLTNLADRAICLVASLEKPVKEIISPWEPEILQQARDLIRGPLETESARC